jgi:hypothetical protein
VLWRKQKEKTVYVPIRGTKPFSEMVSDPDYLRRLSSFQTNEIANDLFSELLGEVRSAADSAKTPDELLAFRVSIAAIKRVWTLPKWAAVQLKAIENAEKDQNHDLGGMR